MPIIAIAQYQLPLWDEYGYSEPKKLDNDNRALKNVTERVTEKIEKVAARG